MNAIFDICCGSEEEGVKRGLFLDETDTYYTDSDNYDDDKNEISKQSVREKAAVALELKRGSRGSIFLSPIDFSVEWSPPKFEKTSDNELFLLERMKEHLLFEELSDEELQTLVDATEKVHLSTGEKLVQQHAQSRYLFFIEKGEFNLICEERGINLGSIDQGQIIGDLALLNGKDSPHSIVAQIDALLWRLDQDIFRNVVGRHARDQDADIISHLRKVDLFQTLSEPILQKFAACLTKVHFNEGDQIVRQGEIGEIFYIIESGAVKVHNIGIGDSQSSEHILTAGESFGERALLTGEPRAASITAIEDVITLAMDRSTFEECLGDLHELMDHKAKIQSLRSLPILANGDLTALEFESLAEHVNEVCYRKGTKIAQIGEPYPMKVWFIRKGQILVYGNKSEEIFNLRSGDNFGEKSILGDPNHISSHEATCEDNVTAWVLTREAIETVIVDLGRLGQSGKMVKKRKSSTMRGLKDVIKHRVLGMGGFGKVWLVESKSSRTALAMKVIQKRRLLDANQHRSVIREKQLLNLLHHPFILNMVSTFQDAQNLYLILPLIQGGELFSLVAERAKGGKGLGDNEAAFYTAGVAEALGHFHHRYIAYRDLKLENVMIDANGYPKIVDLGFAKIILDKSYTFCGTPEYLAPEIIMSKGHNHAVDYWSLGVLVYEMLVGQSPFKKPLDSQMDMFKKIVLVQYEFPPLVSSEAENMVKNLLVRRPLGRIGMQSKGYLDIRTHPWFKKTCIDGKKLLKFDIDVPWVPQVKDPFDASNFDDYSGAEIETAGGLPLSAEEQEIFMDF